MHFAEVLSPCVMHYVSIHAHLQTISYIMHTVGPSGSDYTLVYTHWFQ